MIERKNLAMQEDAFEHLAAQMVATIAGSVPQEVVSLIFASPLSARTPDLCLMWHPGYRKRHRFLLLAGNVTRLPVDLAKGLIRATGLWKPFGYALYGEIKDTLLVVASLCGKEKPDGGYETPYVFSEPKDGLFVFGPITSCGLKAKPVSLLSFWQKLAIGFRLSKAGLSSFCKLSGDLLDRILLLSEWCSWVFGFKWISDYYLEKTLASTVEKFGVKKIGCVHEMHFYARIVWRVASKYQAKSYTVQHAAITEGKRWYFTYPEERESGLALPDVMYVYNQKVIEMLKPYFPVTRFILSCSSRYAQWRLVKPIDAPGKYYLFVGAMASFDSEVLIATLRRLLDSAELMPVRVRLHPTSMLTRAVRRWIQSSSTHGLIKVSEGTPLRDDIEGAKVVIGMSTTVLEEALLLGRPVVQITHPEYLRYLDISDLTGVVIKDWQALTVKDIQLASAIQVDAQKVRLDLGLDEPVVDYDRLFEVEGHRKWPEDEKTVML